MATRMIAAQTTNFKNITAIFLNEGNKDPFGNDVMTLILPDYRYRCVSLPSQDDELTRLRVFLKPGTFINVSYHVPKTNDRSIELDIGDFFISWDTKGWTESGGPHEKTVNDLSDIAHDKQALVKALSVVLDHIRSIPEEWQQKS